MVFEFPFAAPISDVELRPIMNGDKALAQARQAIAAMAGSSALVGARRARPYLPYVR